MEKRIIELYRRKFDDIRHEADGIEYWYARELMKLLDYVQWRNFDNAINKAMISGNIFEIMKKCEGVKSEIKQYGPFILPKILVHNLRVVGQH